MSYRRRRLVNGGSAFSPVSVSAITAWLRNETLSGDIESVPDQLNSNPATQAEPARQPTAVADGSMTFDDVNNCFGWDLTDENNDRDEIGYVFSFKPLSDAVAETLLSIRSQTGGASANKLHILQNSGRLQMTIYMSASTGRIAQTPVASITTGVNFVKFYYSSAGATEADKVKVTINGVSQTLSFSNLGAGEALGTLPAVTGRMLIGALADQAIASSPYGGTMARNLVYALGRDLTATEETNLRNFEPLV